MIFWSHVIVLYRVNGTKRHLYMLKKWLYITELRTSVVTKVNKKHHKILLLFLLFTNRKCNSVSVIAKKASVQNQLN